MTPPCQGHYTDTVVSFFVPGLWRYNRPLIIYHGQKIHCHFQFYCAAPSNVICCVPDDQRRLNRWRRLGPNGINKKDMWFIFKVTNVSHRNKCRYYYSQYSIFFYLWNSIILLMIYRCDVFVLQVQGLQRGGRAALTSSCVWGWGSPWRRRLSPTPAPPCSSMLSRARSTSTGLLCRRRGNSKTLMNPGPIICEDEELSVMGWIRPHKTCALPDYMAKKQSNIHDIDGWSIDGADFPFNMESDMDLNQFNPLIFVTHTHKLRPFETNQICVLCQVWLPLRLRQTAKWFIIHSLCRETDTHSIPALRPTCDPCKSKNQLQQRPRFGLSKDVCPFYKCCICWKQESFLTWIDWK